MDLAVEFSAQFEQDKLHKKFIRTARFFFYLALAGVFTLAFLSDGGNDARYLPFFLLLSCVALSCEMMASAKRVGRGALLSTSFLIFLPWIALQVAEALFLSPFPADATLSLGMNLVPLMFFFIAAQRSRTNGGQTRLLAGTLLLLLGCLVAGITEQIRISEDFSGSLAMKILAGYLSDPVAAGAVTIQILFGCLALALRRGSDPRKRMFAFYVGLLAFGLILLTRHSAVWLSTLAGGLVFTLLYTHKKTVRTISVVLLSCGIALAPLFSEMPFSAPAETTSVQKSETLKNAPQPSRIELQKIALNVFAGSPLLGEGTDSFKAEFRKIAPPAWQVHATTSNSLYTDVLAENGLVGFLCLFVPAGLILFWGTRKSIALLREHNSAVRPNDETKLHNSNTRGILAALIGGIVASGLIFALDFTPSFLPAVLGVSIFAGIVAHESAPACFVHICTWTGKRRRTLFIAAAVLPATLFALFLPVSQSAAHCEVGKRALGPFLQNFYAAPNLEAEHFDPVNTEAAFLAAVDARADNAEAWLNLARLYTLSAYTSPEHIYGLAKASKQAALEACRHAPELAEAQLAKGVAEILLGEKDAALESLRNAEALAPNDLPLLFQVAEAHRMLSSDQTPPKSILKRLTELAPEAPRVRQMNAIIDLNAQSNETGVQKSGSAEPEQSLFEF